MTECIQETFSFTAHFSRRVEAGFTAGRVSSDGGALLLREVDRKVNLLGRLAGCFSDGRDSSRTVFVESSHRPAVSRTDIPARRSFTARRRRSFRAASDNFRPSIFSIL
jgi:hypothetical protein